MVFEFIIFRWNIHFFQYFWWSCLCKLDENISITLEFGICKRESDIVGADEELPLCGYEQREPMDNNKGKHTLF